MANFDTFKTSIDNGQPSVLCYQLFTGAAHAVSVLGYTTSTVNSQTYNYIIVADSWYDDTPRYILFNKGSFLSTASITLSINKVISVL